MDFERIARLARSGIAPGTPEAAALTAELESGVNRRVQAAIEATLAHAIEALRAEGLPVETAAEPGELGFRAATPDGRVLALTVTAAVGVSAGLREAAEQRVLDAPPPWEQRFQATLERARAREAQAGFDALDEAQQLVLVLGGMEAEIANGGFEQYLVNSAGDHANRVLDVLDRVDAPIVRGIVAEALRPFGKAGPPVARDARIAVVHAATPKQRAAWDRLSTRFFAAGEFLPELVDGYLAATVPGWAAEAPPSR